MSDKFVAVFHSACGGSLIGVALVRAVNALLVSRYDSIETWAGVLALTFLGTRLSAMGRSMAQAIDAQEAADGK